MQQERLNNILNNKFDSIEALPDNISFSPSATWDKLESRMVAKPKKKVYLLWYAAAATLLFAIGIAMFLQADKTADFAHATKNEKAAKSQTVTLNSSVTSSTDKAFVGYGNGVAADNKSIEVRKAITAGSSKNQYTNSENVLAATAGNISESVEKDIASEEQVVIPATANTDNTPRTTISAARKLQVVHINDEENNSFSDQLASSEAAPKLINISFKSINSYNSTPSSNTNTSKDGRLFKPITIN